MLTCSRLKGKKSLVYLQLDINPIVTAVTACLNTSKYLTFLRKVGFDLFRFMRSVLRTIRREIVLRIMLLCYCTLIPDVFVLVKGDSIHFYLLFMPSKTRFFNY